MPLPVVSYIPLHLRPRHRPPHSENSSSSRRISFATRYEQVIPQETEEEYDDDDDDDEEFHPRSYTVGTRDDEDDEDDYLSDDNDEDDPVVVEVSEVDEEFDDYNETDDFTTPLIGIRERAARSRSRSPPPPTYHSLTRSSAARSLASLLNDLTTSSAPTRSPTNAFTSIRSIPFLQDEDEDEDEDSDSGIITSSDVAIRSFKRREDQLNKKIQEMLDRSFSVHISKTIFRNHFDRHISTDANTRLTEMKTLDFILGQRQSALHVRNNHKSLLVRDGKSRHRQQRNKRKANGSPASPSTIPDIHGLQNNSFLRAGMSYRSEVSHFELTFTYVSYQQKIVNGIFKSHDVDFAFNGSIVDFVDEDLRYMTIHGADVMKFTMLAHCQVSYSARYQFFEFKKKLEKWHKLPPFNCLEDKKALEKLLTCHHCLNAILENFLLLKLTILINKRDSTDVQDHLQLLVSINRATGEMYVISGEVESLKFKCSSCNFIHSHDPNSSTGNSIIDNILLINNDDRLRHLRNLLINIDLLNELRQGETGNPWMDSVSRSGATVVGNSDGGNVHDNDLNDDMDNDVYNDRGKRLRKNDSHVLLRKAVKTTQKPPLHYDYDKLYVTKFTPNFKGERFNCYDAFIS